MEPITLATAGFIAATFVIAGIVKGVTGMGLPALAMGVLGAVLSPLAAAALLVVPSLVTNVWQLLAGPAVSAVCARLWTMMAAIVAGTVLTSPLLAGGDIRLTTAFLGLALMTYAGFTLGARQLHVPSRHEPWLSPAIGFLTGLMTGATGVFAIPSVPYLQALGLEKDELVQALGLTFTVATVTLALSLGLRGAIQPAQLGWSLAALAPAMLGMWAGQKMRARLSPGRFRVGFLVALFLLGAEMALRLTR